MGAWTPHGHICRTQFSYPLGDTAQLSAPKAKVPGTVVIHRDGPGTPLQPTLSAQAELPAPMGHQLVPQVGARFTNGMWDLPPWGTIQLAENKQVPICLALCLLFLSSQHIVLQENN